MSASKPLRDELKAEFYPFAKSQGFERGRANSFHVPFYRWQGERLQLFYIHWEKYHRPKFVILFGETTNHDQVTLFGEPIPDPPVV